MTKKSKSNEKKVDKVQLWQKADIFQPFDITVYSHSELIYTYRIVINDDGQRITKDVEVVKGKEKKLHSGNLC